MTDIEPIAWTEGGYADPERDLDAASVAEMAHQSAHLLHQHGLRAGGRLAVVDGVGPSLPAVLGTLAAWSLGARVCVEPGDADVAFAPTGHALDADPARRVVRYGGDPPPDAIGFERHLWGENTVPPPESVGPETPAVDGVDHATVAAAARAVAAESDAEHVTIEGSIDGPAALVAACAVPVVAGRWVGPEGTPIDRERVERALDEASG
ncbi:hypothetical protein [Halococcoides cellulosivorans]|uniref:Acetyl-CoA synthetase n=1 Tax=Halococcoides cellulosivorans TaxID=1679096 RepID=A0A2R4WZ70_9EURY|nr:hypothetical protein [Halococcoides cellulosivorans]AWB26828.1 hypothetical protein HARCEL1_03400 [Halococcoides cellulosivorans]